MNPFALKPYIGKDGRAYITEIQNGKAVAVPINNAATLQRDEWKQIDTAVLRAAQFRLRGVADLYSRGLVYRIPNGLGKMVLEYENLSELTGATMSMDGTVHGEKDRPQYDTGYLPLPITHKEFGFNARVLAASRNSGQPLDTTTAELAARVVSEKVEATLFNGASSYTYGNGVIYGYLDYPYRNTVTLGTTWDASAKTGAQIVDDVRAMKQASIDARHFGPWALYVPTAYETVLDDDFKSESDKTIRQRILEIDGIESITVIDSMTADKVVLVQMTPDVVRMVEGLGFTTLEWEQHGGLSFEYKVITIMVPQIRSDQNGNCGVTVLSQ
jgi:hypothetical protein